MNKVKVIPRVPCYAVRRIVKIGATNYLKLDPSWVHQHTQPIEGGTYVAVDFDGNKLVCTGIDESSIERIEK